MKKKKNKKKRKTNIWDGRTSLAEHLEASKNPARKMEQTVALKLYVKIILIVTLCGVFLRMHVVVYGNPRKRELVGKI